MTLDNTNKDSDNLQELRLKRVRRITESLIGLPALPMTVTRLITAISSPQVTARDLARLISSDQAVTAKVLKLANSAFYGFSRKVSTVSLAIVVLGFDTVKDLVLSLSIMDRFSTKNDTSGLFDHTRFWEHSMAVGIMSRLIAQKHNTELRGEVSVAGLMHDLGKQIFNRYMTKEYNMLLQIARDSEFPIRKVEEEYVGANHARVGGWLMENWNLPEILVDAISYHHDPLSAKTTRIMPAIVHLANIIVKMNNIGFSGDTYIPEPDSDALALIGRGVTDEDIGELCEQLPSEMDVMESFTNILNIKAPEELKQI